MLLSFSSAFRRNTIVAVAASLLLVPSTARAECGMFFCWTEEDIFLDDYAHSGSPSEPTWGDPGEAEWSITHVHGSDHFSAVEYGNWHDYASPDWLEMSSHQHYNCGSGGNES